MVGEERPAAVYVAPFPGSHGGEALVVIWQDGSAEISYRAKPSHSWGPPEPMERRATT